MEEVLANTFKTYWWLGTSSTGTASESSGSLWLIYTYPDTVYAGERFNVGVTFVYIKDKFAHTNWLVFSNVTVGLRPLYSSYQENVVSNVEYSQNIIRPGDHYSHSFSLIAPDSPGFYIVAPTWIALYGPGGIGTGFTWDIGNYYNVTWRDAGLISPKRYPPINVIEKEVEGRHLVIELDDPYSKIKPVNIGVTNKTYSKIDTVTDGIFRISLPLNSSYNVTIPKMIDMVPNKIRATFLGWSDGARYDERDKYIVRNVKLNSNVELYALYKTQYNLVVRSTLYNSNPEGTGWYNGGSEAQFSINPYVGFFLLQSFDHWTGDLYGTTTASSSSLIMDGPKEITAIWKFDYTYFGAILGLVTGIIAILGKIKSGLIQRFFGFRGKK